MLSVHYSEVIPEEAGGTMSNIESTPPACKACTSARKLSPVPSYLFLFILGTRRIALGECCTIHKSNFSQVMIWKMLTQGLCGHHPNPTTTHKPGALPAQHMYGASLASRDLLRPETVGPKPYTTLGPSQVCPDTLVFRTRVNGKHFCPLTVRTPESKEQA